MSSPPDRARASRAITEFLAAIGRDTASADLDGTGARVADMFVDELCAGYAVDSDRLLRENLIARPAGAPSEIVVRQIAITTMCPHHLLPASGTASVAFGPQAHLLGLGAVADFVDARARRLVLQETLSEEIVEGLFRALEPRWVACTLTLSHGCMTARGGRHRHAAVATWSVRGAVDAATLARVLGGSP